MRKISLSAAIFLLVFGLHLTASAQTIGLQNPQTASLLSSLERVLNDIGRILTGLSDVGSGTNPSRASAAFINAVTVAPASREIASGGTVTLSLDVSPDATIGYIQWLCGPTGITVSNSSNPGYACGTENQVAQVSIPIFIANASLTKQTVTFRVRVDSTSRDAQVSVLPVPPTASLTSPSAGATINSGDSITLNAAGTNYTRTSIYFDNCSVVIPGFLCSPQGGIYIPIAVTTFAVHNSSGIEQPVTFTLVAANDAGPATSEVRDNDSPGYLHRRIETFLL